MPTQRGGASPNTRGGVRTTEETVTTPAPRRLALRDGAGYALLDDVAKRIIEQLQADGRRPYAAIRKAVGLSEAAVRQRV